MKVLQDVCNCRTACLHVERICLIFEQGSKPARTSVAGVCFKWRSLLFEIKSKRKTYDDFFSRPYICLKRRTIISVSVNMFEDFFSKFQECIRNVRIITFFRKCEHIVTVHYLRGMQRYGEAKQVHALITPHELPVGRWCRTLPPSLTPTWSQMYSLISRVSETPISQFTSLWEISDPRQCSHDVGGALSAR